MSRVATAHRDVKISTVEEVKAVEVKGSVFFNDKNSYIFSPCHDNAMEMNVILFVVLDASQKLHRANQESVM